MQFSRRALFAAPLALGALAALPERTPQFTALTARVVPMMPARASVLADIAQVTGVPTHLLEGIAAETLGAVSA